MYIGSFGGVVFWAEHLRMLLKARSQDGQEPCRLITVATTHAGSAAAELLVRGDYVIAYPSSIIHFHGVRQISLEVTSEKAADLRVALREQNQRSASEHAVSAGDRFIFRYCCSRGGFPAIRETLQEPDKSDHECMVYDLQCSLSASGRKVLNLALSRQERYRKLMGFVLAKMQASQNPSAEGEAELLKQMIDFTLQEHAQDSNWSFEKDSLSQLSQDFMLVAEYYDHITAMLQTLDRWSAFIFRTEERTESQKLETVLDAWSFFAALCHVLREEENLLTAQDALLFGLIDEVIGEPGLTQRAVMEEYEKINRKKPRSRVAPPPRPAAPAAEPDIT